MDNVCTYKSQKIKDIRRMVQVARGEEPADLVLKNGEVFNVFTGEFLNRDIAIVDGEEKNFKITTPADLERFREMV